LYDSLNKILVYKSISVFIGVGATIKEAKEKAIALNLRK